MRSEAQLLTQLFFGKSRLQWFQSSLDLSVCALSCQWPRMSYGDLWRSATNNIGILLQVMMYWRKYQFKFRGHMTGKMTCFSFCWDKGFSQQSKGRQPIETIATSRHSEVKYVSATGASGLMLLKWLLMCQQQWKQPCVKLTYQTL